jgi:hypothetical protein
MTFHATAYYRTHGGCNTVLFDVKADDFDAALTEARRLFATRRPRALRLDRIEIVRA